VRIPESGSLQRSSREVEYAGVFLLSWPGDTDEKDGRHVTREALRCPHAFRWTI
jgi:hypothetical protein